MARVRHHRYAAGNASEFFSHPLARFYHALVRPLQIAVILTLAATFVLLGVRHVSAVHEARKAREAICRAELRALKATAFVRHFVEPSDPCEALKVVAR